MSSKHDRCLFLSFSGAVRALRRRDVTRTDFRNALFWVGCMRDVVTGPIEVGMDHAFSWSHYGLRPKPDMSPFYVFVRESVLMAEKEERVVWREPDSECRLESIEALLTRFGYDTERAYAEVLKWPGASQLFGWTRAEAFRRPSMVDRFGWQHLDLRVFHQWGRLYRPE